MPGTYSEVSAQERAVRKSSDPFPGTVPLLYIQNPHQLCDRWTEWCKYNRVKDPMRPRATDTANYLAYLAHTQNLLKTCRSEISSVWAAKGLGSTASDPLITGVLKGTANSQPRTPSLVLKWDLQSTSTFSKVLTSEKTSCLAMCP